LNIKSACHDPAADSPRRAELHPAGLGAPAVTGSSNPLTPRQNAIIAEFDAVFRKDARGKWGEG
jgi:hypothetical protein